MNQGALPPQSTYGAENSIKSPLILAM